MRAARLQTHLRASTDLRPALGSFAEEYSFKRPAYPLFCMSKPTQIVVGTVGVSAALSVLIILSYVLS